MAGSAGKGRKGVIAGINMTPFVDIVLVLLVVFLMAARLVNNPAAMKVELPKAANAERSDEPSEILTITISAAGLTEVDGKRIDWDAFAPRAQAAERIIIAAHGDAAHRHVVSAMDELAKRNVTRVAFAVTKDAVR